MTYKVYHILIKKNKTCIKCDFKTFIVSKEHKNLQPHFAWVVPITVHAFSSKPEGVPRTKDADVP